LDGEGEGQRQGEAMIMVGLCAVRLWIEKRMDGSSTGCRLGCKSHDCHVDICDWLVTRETVVMSQLYQVHNAAINQYYLKNLDKCR